VNIDRHNKNNYMNLYPFLEYSSNFSWISSFDFFTMCSESSVNLV
jgi:hypothetical protein